MFSLSISFCLSLCLFLSVYLSDYFCGTIKHSPSVCFSLYLSLCLFLSVCISILQSISVTQSYIPRLSVSYILMLVSQFTLFLLIPHPPTQHPTLNKPTLANWMYYRKSMFSISIRAREIVEKWKSWNQFRHNLPIICPASSVLTRVLIPDGVSQNTRRTRQGKQVFKIRSNLQQLSILNIAFFTKKKCALMIELSIHYNKNNGSSSLSKPCNLISYISQRHSLQYISPKYVILRYNNKKLLFLSFLSSIFPSFLSPFLRLFVHSFICSFLPSFPPCPPPPR